MGEDGGRQAWHVWRHLSQADVEVNFSVPAAEHKNNVAALQCPCLRLPAFPFFKGHPPSCCCNWSPVRGCCCSILSASRLWILVSGCGTNRCYGSRIKSVREKKKQQQWLCRRGWERNNPIVDVQAISRLFHELLTRNLLCDPNNKNSGDKWRKLGGKWTLWEIAVFSSTTSSTRKGDGTNKRHSSRQFIFWRNFRTW